MRQSPLLLVYKVFSIGRNAIFFYLFLFVVKRDSSAIFFEFSRNTFWFIIYFSLIYILLDWWLTTFKLDQQQLTKRSGIFVRKTQQAPIAQLEHVTVKKQWFHRLTNTVACSYQLVDAKEELKIEMIAEKKINDLQTKPLPQSMHVDIIFQPTRMQLVKASFTSLRFLLAIPFLASIYSRIDHFIHLEQYTATFIENVMTNSIWLISTIAVYVAISLLCALVFTFIKFGRDQVIKDENQLVIRKGMINESKVTMSLSNITGIEVRQSFLKRLLGLAEIRLQFKSRDVNELQSVYPYFEYEQAIAFVNTHFPKFTIYSEQDSLTKISLIPRIFRASMLLILIWFACFLGREWIPFSYYWLGTAGSFIVLVGVILAYLQFQFGVHDEQIQLRHGIFGSKITIIGLSNICDVELEQSLLQRWLGLRTMSVRAYTDQLVEYQLKDVRAEVLKNIQQAYLKSGKT